MKILLLGKNGQVGWELQRALAPLGELVALGREAMDAEGHTLRGDLADLDGLARTVRAVRPDVIVNAAAYTAVDKAESDVEQAELLNGLAPGVLAREAAAMGALLIHYSTDYVFDGSGARPWTETDATGPVSVYGRTKLQGEQAIAAAGCRHLIFRTSWVYAARGGNFAKTMLRLAGERDALSVIDDQKGAPTGADLIADVTAHAMVRALREPALCGLYHLVAAGETSWNEYARLVLSVALKRGFELKATPDKVAPVPTSSYKTAARRPLNSRLDTAKLRGAFGVSLPAWQSGVERMIAEISENKP
ncbi:dTDP-4-dehydrorhamnose reductase [Bordetella genomosp. 8]|uniref:dTDP-4-dehydrorhamnose reductase n=1 Tax=Bordetella genomosp. 8 TaxID=1416806 RepID=A0A1W6YSM4_9BORD|nr:dTDP-4-dehydrorhamnose reductase [Bordetella genomosp. 8]ARP84105.1 dTDP-4-dehydrorhamnose reductase [Bordetella genomosp. 8]